MHFNVLSSSSSSPLSMINQLVVDVLLKQFYDSSSLDSRINTCLCMRRSLSHMTDELLCRSINHALSQLSLSTIKGKIQEQLLIRRCPMCLVFLIFPLGHILVFSFRSYFWYHNCGLGNELYIIKQAVSYTILENLRQWKDATRPGNQPHTAISSLAITGRVFP